MKYILSFFLLTYASFTQAETLWSDFSLTLLKGDNYEVGDSDRNVLTVEYTSQMNWGRQFFFVDRLESSNGDNETYSEWSPNYQINDFEAGFMKNLYLAGTIEFGAFSGASGFSNSFTNYLVGVSTDLNIPHFSFASLTLYHRNNEQSDNGYQATLVWGLPLGPLFYDGFIDFTTSTDDAETSMNLTSQLKYDLAPHLNLTTKLYVGIEYVFWQNKFGIDGVDEKNMNLLVKYHF